VGVGEHLGRGDLVVLHHGRQGPRDAGEEVHEVPGVGVVVVDHDDLRRVLHQSIGK